jgi:hypothetical protein
MNLVNPSHEIEPSFSENILYRCLISMTSFSENQVYVFPKQVISDFRKDWSGSSSDTGNQKDYRGSPVFFLLLKLYSLLKLPELDDIIYLLIN